MNESKPTKVGKLTTALANVLAGADVNTEAQKIGIDLKKFGYDPKVNNGKKD